jgi:hypothetical protein
VNHYQWKPLDGPEGMAKLAAILESWRDTPYFPGQATKKVGVDCARFVACVLDELNGTQTDMTTLPPDTAVHAPKAAAKALKFLIEKFDCEEVMGDVLEPGDILATGPIDGGPGHAVIVGPQRRVCWDSSNSSGGRGRVRQISIGLQALVGQKVFGVYRQRNRTWAAAPREES